MSKPMPIFRAVLVRPMSFEDTNSTKVIARITHAGLNGEDPTELSHRHELQAQPLVTFRLTGANALADLADSYARRLADHEQVTVEPGTVLYLNAQGIAVWNGTATYQEQPVHRLIGFQPASLSIQPRVKMLPLTFAVGRVEAAVVAGATDPVPVAV
jgi:hypothetical protein